MSKTTIIPHHLPRGTVIEVGLYRRPREGETGPQQTTSLINDPAQFPARFTVDHIQIVDVCTGRNYMVVTTTPHPVNSVFLGENIAFNIDHVDRVVKRGHKTVFKSYKGADAPRKDSWTNKQKYSSNDIYRLIDFKLNQEHPLIQFDIESMFSMAFQCGVIRHKASDPKRGSYSWYYTVNRRKFSAWIKRNKNRFIYSEKALASIKKAALDEERRCLEEAWEREYMQDPDDAVATDEETPVTDYPENLGGPFFSVLDVQESAVDYVKQLLIGDYYARIF